MAYASQSEMIEGVAQYARDWEGGPYSVKPPRDCLRCQVGIWSPVGLRVTGLKYQLCNSCASSQMRYSVEEGQLMPELRDRDEALVIAAAALFDLQSRAMALLRTLAEERGVDTSDAGAMTRLAEEALLIRPPADVVEVSAGLMLDEWLVSLREAGDGGPSPEAALEWLNVSLEAAQKVGDAKYVDSRKLRAHREADAIVRQAGGEGLTDA